MTRPEPDPSRPSAILCDRAVFLRFRFWGNFGGRTPPEPSTPKLPTLEPQTGSSGPNPFIYSVLAQVCGCVCVWSSSLHRGSFYRGEAQGQAIPGQPLGQKQHHFRAQPHKTTTTTNTNRPRYRPQAKNHQRYRARNPEITNFNFTPELPCLFSFKPFPGKLLIWIPRSGSA